MKILYMISCPPVDIHRVAIRPGNKELSRSARSKGKKLSKLLELLRNYSEGGNEICVCFADCLDAYNISAKEFIKGLNNAYSKESCCDKTEPTASIKFIEAFCSEYFDINLDTLAYLANNNQLVHICFSGERFISLRQQAAEDIDPYFKHFQNTKKGIELLRWKGFLEHPKYEEKLEEIKNFYNKNLQFRAAVDGMVKERVGKDIAKIMCATITSERLNIVRIILEALRKEYVFEETAHWSLLSCEYDFTHLAYNEELNKPMEFMRQTKKLKFINAKLLPQDAKNQSKSAAKSQNTVAQAHYANSFIPTVLKAKPYKVANVKLEPSPSTEPGEEKLETQRPLPPTCLFFRHCFGWAEELAKPPAKAQCSLS